MSKGNFLIVLDVWGILVILVFFYLFSSFYIFYGYLRELIGFKGFMFRTFCGFRGILLIWEYNGHYSDF